MSDKPKYHKIFNYTQPMNFNGIDTLDKIKHEWKTKYPDKQLKFITFKRLMRSPFGALTSPPKHDHLFIMRVYSTDHTLKQPPKALHLKWESLLDPF